ncbi:hypothetical protein NA56DRAFT_737052, partial [Hyaloscypha hepaticicola]
RFSIGLRSGNYNGQFIRFIPLFTKYLVTTLALYHGVLSSCITTSSPYFALISS